MTDASGKNWAPDYIYVTYIKTTPQKVWDALTVPEFTRAYWTHANISDWKPGSVWEHKTSEGRVLMHGKVVESNPPKRLSFTWLAPSADNAEKDPALAIFDIETVGDMVRLTVTHTRLPAGAGMALNVAKGWPRVLSSMKSWLETGMALDTWAEFQTCDSQPAAAAAE